MIGILMTPVSQSHVCPMGGLFAGMNGMPGRTAAKHLIRGTFLHWQERPRNVKILTFAARRFGGGEPATGQIHARLSGTINARPVSA